MSGVNVDFKKIFKKYSVYIPLFLVLAAAFWLRFANLGYSDFQGDEIKALFLPEQGQSIADFLFSQRKGPTQFIVTYFMAFLDPAYQNQFLIRLPFALTSFLSVVFFYLFVKMNFGRKVALYATFFFAVNGLFVAFARIVQYQSFVILFYVLALYFFTLAAKTVRWRIAGLYYGMTFWGLSMLSHYDGLFIAPFVLYLLWQWFKIFPAHKWWIKFMHIMLSGLIPAIILGLFYVPFFLSVSDSTIQYWLTRLGGTGGKISSSIVTFKVYNPKFVVDLYIVLFGIYLFRTVVVLASKKFSNIKVTEEKYKLHRESLAVLVWLAFPLIFMEAITSIPGTHIYTYLTPLVILMAIGVIFIEDIVKRFFGLKWGSVLSAAGVFTVFLLMFYLSHKVFVDHTREYPFEEEKYLIWTLEKPNVIFHLSIFGFPYYRHWEDIGTYVTRTENNGFYSTNERSSIARFYIPFNKDTDSAGHFVYIHSPQSWTSDIIQEKADWWLKNKGPAKTFANCDYGDFAYGGDFLYVFAPVSGDCSSAPNGERVVTEVLYMPAGPLEDIRD